MQYIRRAASRACSTNGIVKQAMPTTIAVTTSSSVRVNARRNSVGEFLLQGRHWLRKFIDEYLRCRSLCVCNSTMSLYAHNALSKLRVRVVATLTRAWETIEYRL